MASALERGEASVVVASPSHRRGLSARIRAGQFDLDAAIKSGRYLEMDADKTLAKFMVDGAVDRRRFQMVIGAVIDRANDAAEMQPSRAAVFGEMVARLIMRGQTEAALRLEKEWNSLAENHRFSPHCAYPLRALRKEADGDALRKVCAGHDRVVPAKAYTSNDDDDMRL